MGKNSSDWLKILSVIVVLALVRGLASLLERSPEDELRSQLLQTYKEAGAPAEVRDDSLVVSLTYEAGEVEGIALCRAAPEERRALVAARQLRISAKELKTLTEYFKKLDINHMSYSHHYPDGSESMETLSRGELWRLSGSRSDMKSWQEPMRGYLRQLTRVCAECYPMDDDGNRLRGAALEQARRTKDGLYITPYRLVGDTLFEVMSRPRITEKDIADNSLDEDAREKLLTNNISNWESDLALVYLANVDYVQRYESPDGTAYEICFPSLMVEWNYSLYRDK